MKQTTACSSSLYYSFGERVSRQLCSQFNIRLVRMFFGIGFSFPNVGYVAIRTVVIPSVLFLLRPVQCSDFFPSSRNVLHSLFCAVVIFMSPSLSGVLDFTSCEILPRFHIHLHYNDLFTFVLSVMSFLPFFSEVLTRSSLLSFPLSVMLCFSHRSQSAVCFTLFMASSDMLLRSMFFTWLLGRWV